MREPRPVRSRVIAEVDYMAEGRQLGYLRVPHAHNDSAWGAVPVPILVVRKGDGPTLLLTGGVHGDEYEGPIILSDLVRELGPDEIKGRLIVVPTLHFPAAAAGTRLSPIDQLDLNRSFPGDPGGSFAQVLAHYVGEVLLPMCDVNVDLHSGGRSLDCLPCTMSHIPDDAEVSERTLTLARAFGAPLHVMNREVDGAHTLQSRAEALGVISLSSELGGGNRVNLDGLAIGARGVRNVLRHLGMVAGKAEPAAATRVMLLPDVGSYGFAPAGGIFYPRHRLGTWVEAGQEAGAIYDIADPSRAPTIFHYRRSGLLWCQRGQGRIKPGDSAAVVVRPDSESG